MKKKIHPPYYDVVARCACGAEYKMKSTKKELKMDVCGSCHPFFTGTQKILDTAGRVERFRKKYSKTTKKEK